MRITGGVARGRPVRAPKGDHVRPTADKVRGAIFNILATRIEIENGRWMDLFAGSGAVGLEALSRGAQSVIFVDESPSSCRMVRENVERTGFADRSEIRRLRLPAALTGLEGRFRGAFVDPPYRRGLCAGTLAVLGARPLIEAGGIVVAEHAADDDLEERYGRLVRIDARRYGSTALTLYSCVEEP